ncbi:hypothetical protein [Pedobacter deserti]|uniref:hypothetical protein n=1 Tax=Pedobacter deserti TaxID=2817382 RepID=UPI00210B9100|nr:hypothetical protein [Pedobacter sp. SYSU D00382]
MKQNFIQYIYELSKRLIEAFGFQIKTELNEGESYMIEYSSGNYVIKIEKYFREFYATLYKLNKPDKEINLFNLLEYLRQSDAQDIKSEYFRDEIDIEECYKKQLNHISGVLYENYNLIDDFFCGNDYELKMAEFEKYWRNKHPF